MYNIPIPYPFWINPQMVYPYLFWINPNMMYPPKSKVNTPMYNQNFNETTIDLRDNRSFPLVIDIGEAVEHNNTFRTVLWTGNNLQVTVMYIGVGEDIGLEIHPNGDQFIRIEDGDGFVVMGDSQDNLDFQRRVSDDAAIMIPAGKWHNIINIGDDPLKLYVIYAPPEHPENTVHQTKSDADANMS